ncbi:MAG: hypothetical protein JNK76_20965 [Planctomycetales bacterium]|nr:hypothetical protein [Planctomycetales bacterium]MBN8628318.1 hypothetical protein [Planctomycetota bacterium]
MLEKYGSMFLLAGFITTAIGLIWYLPRLARKGRSGAAAPRWLIIIGLLMIGGAYGAVWLERQLPLRPYEQIVDGELRVTTTDIKGFDYAKLVEERPEIVVLQMANSDVTDATLAPLARLPKLRTLDIRDTQVTDAGLATLATLPLLEELYLGRTKITDAGFQQHLASKESLRKLDFTGTEVKGKTKRDWKAKKPEVRDYTD